MSDEIETIDRNPKSWAAWKREAERLQNIIDDMAAMDSEPVADVVAWSHPTEERTCDIRWRRHDVEPGPLYRHAQPAPQLKPVGYLFVSDQGDIAYSPTDWGMPGFKLAGQIFGDIDVKEQPAPLVSEVSPLVSEQPAPVVPDDVRQALSKMDDEIIAELDVEENACRAAMLNGGKS